MQLEISNDEFKIIKKALGHSSYSNIEERAEFLKLANRLSHIVPIESLPNFVMGEGFPMVAIREDETCLYDDEVDD